MTKRLDFFYIIQLECWSDGVLECCKRKIDLLIITPSLHYSNSPKTLEIVRYCKGFAFWKINSRFGFHV